MISLEGLCIDLPGFAVQDVHLTIETGEFFTLLGPTGAGKTLILEAIGGLMPVTGGRILIDDRDMTGVPTENRGVGIVYQDCALFPHLSVMKNIAYGLRYHKRFPERDLKRLIHGLNLDALLHRSIHHLSGGEKQRVALARALAVNPSVLLLDEPLSALDPNFREEVRKALKKLHRDTGITFLMVTHDFAEALYLADRGAVINQGQIEQVGNIHEIFTKPKTPGVADFVGMKNVFEAVFHGTKAVIDELEMELGRVVDQAKGYVAVRPEDILVSPRAIAREGYHVYEGKVIDLVEQGFFYEIVVAMGGLAFNALVYKGSIEDLKPMDGNEVFIGMRPSSIHVF
jgi:molybdate/tungstate transport system ATP-binding protein